MKRIVSGVMLTLILASMLTLPFSIQPVKGWTGTVYIRADGSIDPPDAPLKTLDNLTYTMTGNIESSADGIVVERDNIIIDGAGHTVQGTIQVTIGCSNKGIVFDEGHNNTIRDVEIKNFFYGIYLYDSSDNNISKNNITNNGLGIYLYYSSNNSISGNNITNNNYVGINLLWESSGNNISGNTFFHDGLLVEDSRKNVVADNSVNGKPLVYLEGVSDLVVEDAGQVILVDSVNITVKGLNLASTSVGIELLGTNNTKIAGNNITNNFVGIYLYGSSSNNISKNNVTNNEWQGIFLGYSSNNNISGNNITNSWWGMGLDSSSNSMLRNNSMANNTYNFGVLGRSSADYVNDVDTSNTVDGKPIYYWVNKRDMTVPLDAGYVALINCTNITVKNLDLKNNIENLLLAHTINSVITHNNMTNSWYRLHIGVAGIYLYDSSGNSISGNNITNNDVGIFLRYSSNNNSISGNNIAANNDHGISLGYSSNNNSISRNNITNNGGGIYLYDSSGNSISRNNITNNLWGILLQHSSNNNIYHNNFINNTYQVASEDSVNVCDDDYPSGGNYWSDYTDVDLYYGPYQNQTGCDGIWDHPYIIDQNNRDRYPLVNPWTPISGYVQGIDVSHHQGDINWTQVYGAGYRFAFIKATGGVSFTDPNFTANMEKASEAGLIVGAYHFAYPEYYDAVSEAQHFISVAGNYMKTGYLRPVLDLEDDPAENSYPYRMGKDNLSNWIHTWMNTVKNETGIEPIIYTGWYARVGDYLNDSIAEYDLWIADWTYDPAISPDTGIWESWDFWQYSNKGAIPGIAGDVDLDLFNGYMQRLYDAFTIPNVKVFNVVWENKTCPITVYSNSTITHLVFNQTQAQISLNITGSHGSKGYCNITIPKDLLKGKWTYTMDGETPSVIDISEDENATHSFIYLTYIHASTFRITIQGAWVVPEFPSTIILPLFMLTTLIATALLKKKRKTKPYLP